MNQYSLPDFDKNEEIKFEVEEGNPDVQYITHNL